MDVTVDDSPKSHDQNGNAKKHVLKVHSLSLKELSPEMTYSDICNQTYALLGESEFGTESKALEKSPCKLQQGAVFSGKILSFCCSECKGDITYSPNDLLKHFQGVHKGTLPTYPCDLCSFVTNEFSSLQRHRIGHRDTLVTCEICNDGVQYSLLLLTRHFILCHSCNGLFLCKKCDFSTRDAGTFVQHIHHHKEDNQKYMKGPSVSPTHAKVYGGKATTFPFTCQFCGFGASWKEYLNKHMSVAHGDEVDRTSKRKSIEEGSKINSPGLKLLLKKSPPTGGSREPQWISLLDTNGRLINAEKTLGETQQFLERAVGVKKDGNKWSKEILKSEKKNLCSAVSSSAQPKIQENDLALGSGILDTSNSNGLTVLMFKNKISIPPNCTTKVMGFKMVDGKKHLVLKVIPTKQEPETQNEEDKKTTSSLNASMSSISGCMIGPDFEKKRDLSDLIKIKTQDGVNNTLELESQSVQKCKANEVCREVLQPPAYHIHELSSSRLVANQSQSANSSTEDLSVEKTSRLESTLQDTVASSLITVSASKTPLCPSTSDCVKKDVTAATVDLCGSLTERTTPQSSNHSFAGDDQCLDLHEQEPPLCENVEIVTTCPADVCKSVLSTATDDTCKNSQDTNGTADGRNAASVTDLQNRSPQNTQTPTDLLSSSDGSAGVQAASQNSLNQEVFSFHNYSKEAFGSSSWIPPLVDLLNVDQSPGDLEEDDYEDNFKELKLDPDWSSKLSASPLTGVGHPENGSSSLEKSFERVSDSDIEVDECIATVDELPIALMENRDGISEPKRKDAECSVPERGTANLTSAAVLGKILEKHSDAIISQQLEKDRMVATTVTQDANRSATTTLRILQMPAGKRQMFLQTAKTPYAVPVHLKGGPRFKLITKSCGSQVNVSCVMPGTERSCKRSGLPLNLNNGRIGMSTQEVGMKAKSQSSAVQSVRGSGGHYIVNASALKKQPLLSSLAKSSSDEQNTNTQKTYLVHQPLPISQLSSEVLRPKTTRPVLALPVSPNDKAAHSQTGRQAFLVRYVSQTKSGLLVNSSNEKGVDQASHSYPTGKNRYLVVRGPNGTRILATAPLTPSKKPIYVSAGSLQSPYILMSSNNSITKCSAGLNASHRLVPSKLKDVSLKTTTHKRADNLQSLLTPTDSGSRSLQRRKRSLFRGSLETRYKTRKGSSTAQKRTILPWKPVAKDVKRVLRLTPFRLFQKIRCPRLNQPVVVLNHPDADIPQVVNIMKSIHKHRGKVSKVTLSQNTVKALSKTSPISRNGAFCATDIVRCTGNNVKERFILKLKLKKKKRRKYEVVKSSSTGDSDQASVFRCWFCARAFTNQEDWIGHGQRHLMEATRDWNQLF